MHKILKDEKYVIELLNCSTNYNLIHEFTIWDQDNYKKLCTLSAIYAKSWYVINKKEVSKKPPVRMYP